MMDRYCLAVLLFGAFLIGTCAAYRPRRRDRGHRYEAKDKSAADFAKVVIRYLSKTGGVEPFKVEDFEQTSRDGRRLTFKQGTVSGFFDLKARDAKYWERYIDDEFTFVLIVPEIELTGFAKYGDRDSSSAEPVKLVMTAINARYQMGLFYNATHVIVVESEFDDMDKILVSEVEEERDRTRGGRDDDFKDLAEEIFITVLKTNVPDALIETLEDPRLFEYVEQNFAFIHY